jgi:hypothetical protein
MDLETEYAVPEYVISDGVATCFRTLDVTIGCMGKSSSQRLRENHQMGTWASRNIQYLHIGCCDSAVQRRRRNTRSLQPLTSWRWLQMYRAVHYWTPTRSLACGLLSCCTSSAEMARIHSCTQRSGAVSRPNAEACRDMRARCADFPRNVSNRVLAWRREDKGVTNSP